MATNNAFWNQLLMRSDSIADIDPNATDAAERVLAQLNTIAEQFDRVFDPADQFEEYVAVNFCQALQRALTPKNAAPVCKVSVQNKIVSAPEKPVVPSKAQPVKKAKPAPVSPPQGKRNNVKSDKKTPSGAGRNGKSG